MGGASASNLELVAAVERSVRTQLGVAPVRASITFLGVEPLEVLRFDLDDTRVHVSLGMCRRPMTEASSATVVVGGPRAELSITTRLSRIDRGDGGLWRRLAVFAAAPEVEGVVYREGMTVDLGEPLVPRSRCTGVLLRRSALAPVRYEAMEVSILQLDPVTNAELAWSRVHGTSALRKRWSAQAVDLLDLERLAARLD